MHHEAPLLLSKEFLSYLQLAVTLEKTYMIRAKQMMLQEDVRTEPQVCGLDLIADMPASYKTLTYSQTKDVLH